MKRSILFIFIFVIFIIHCEKNPNKPDYQKEITVFGYLWGDENLNADHAILISYTQPITAFYDLNLAGISGANVTITEESSGDIVQLQEALEKPGFYFNDNLNIKPKETYHLRTEIDGKVVTASTTVPPVLTLVTELDRDTVNNVYHKNLSKRKPIFVECEDVEQLIMVDMFCNEEYQNAEIINPFHESHKYPGDREEYDGGINGEPRHIQGIGRIREFISDDYPAQYVVDWYSSMLVFYGSYTMQVVNIDDNFHNFLYKEHPEYEGGIHGGLGVFGSVCGDVFEMDVLKE